jgi:hypothetical protein
MSGVFVIKRHDLATTAMFRIRVCNSYSLMLRAGALINHFSLLTPSFPAHNWI